MPDDGWLYIVETDPLSPDTPCLVVTDDDYDGILIVDGIFERDPVAVTALGAVAFLNKSDLRSVVRVEMEQARKRDIAHLVAAAIYYFLHDAFMAHRPDR